MQAGFAPLRDDAALRDELLALYAPGRPPPDAAALCAALAGREIELPVPGGAVRADLADWTALLMLRLGGWEPQLWGLAAHFVGPGSTAVDVGAHVGGWTLLLAALVGASGRVLACEPVAASAARARAAVAAAGVAGRVRIVEAAVGAQAGRAPLYALAGAGADSMLHSLLPAEGWAPAPAGEVPVVRLDDLGLDRPAFVKIDTEGLELQVLRGARELLASAGPALLIELHPEALAGQGLAPADVYAELRGQGYTVFDLVPTGHELLAEPLHDGRLPATHHILAQRAAAGPRVPLRGGFAPPAGLP